jgi:hypothetical protein
MATEDINETSGSNPADLSKAPIVTPENGTFEAYANIINFNWTLTDVRIRFGELVQQSKEGSAGTWMDQETAILERATITVPWHQIKTLVMTLENLLMKYEKLNGEIKEIKLPIL